MAFLDYTDAAWRGEDGSISRILVGEQTNYIYNNSGAAAIDGTRLADSTNNGLYKYQLALNPDSDLGATLNFIENPALTGDLTAKPGEPGRREIAGTLYLPLTGDGNAVFIRNVLQSKTSSGSSATISATTAQGKLSTDVVAASTSLDSSSITAGDITTGTKNTGTGNVARLKVTLAGFTNSGNTRDVTAGGFGVIEITGTDWNDEIINEQILVPADSSATATFDSLYYYKSVTAVDTSGFLSAGSGTFKIEAFDNSQTVVFDPDDTDMWSFLSLEFDKGGVPNTYRGMYASGCRIEVGGPDELLQLAIEMSGRSSHLFENLAGTKIPGVTSANKSTITTTNYRTNINASGLSGMEIISEDLMVGARTLVSMGVGDAKLPVINASLDFGLRIERSPVLTGDPTVASRPYRRRRQPLLTGEIQYSKQSNFSVDALNSIQQNLVKVTFARKTVGGFPFEHTVQFRKAQFQEVGDPTIVDDLVRQRFSLLGLPSAAGQVDDLKWTALYSKYSAVRNY